MKAGGSVQHLTQQEWDKCKRPVGEVTGFLLNLSMHIRLSREPNSLLGKSSPIGWDNMAGLGVARWRKQGSCLYEAQYGEQSTTAKA